jgi:hypothetical protein
MCHPEAGTAQGPLMIAITPAVILSAVNDAERRW